MALFDFTHMGKEYVSQRRNKEKKEPEKIEENPLVRSEGPQPLVEVEENEVGNIAGRMCSADTLDPMMLEDVQDEDTETSGNSDNDSACSEPNRKISIFRQGTRSALRTLSSFSLRSKTKEDKPVEPKKELEDFEYESITVEESNSLSLNAFKSGYGPAYLILKTMNRKDREAIMKMLFIKRKTAFYNDERDSYAILFTKIFGIRGRTNTALRSIRVLKQATWVHSVLKVATALTFSTRMVISSGDWRLPTRVTDRLTHKQAMAATTSGFEEGSEDVLWKAEIKFYTKLQKNIEARLGKQASKAIVAWVKQKAGPELASVFEKSTRNGNTEEMDSFASASGSESAFNASSTGENVAVDAVEPVVEDDAELKELEDSFHIPQMIRNIERAKPGFGRFIILIIEIFALKAKADAEGDFQFSNQKEMVKKLALVGLKDGVIGLSVGIPLATFVNPFLGFPLMFYSFFNLSMGSTEFNIIEPVCMIMIQQLVLACNGTSVRDHL